MHFQCSSISILCHNGYFFLPYQLEKGLPALLIYKGGDMIGNFLNISSQIGEECLINDVEGFLQE